MASACVMLSSAVKAQTFSRKALPSPSDVVTTPNDLEPQQGAIGGGGGTPGPVYPVQPQMRKWNLIPTAVSFLGTQPQAFSNPNLPNDGSLTASALDEDDKLLFLIKYGIDPNGGLYDANGALRATIPAYTSTTIRDSNGIPILYRSWGREMAVVPVPGVCKQFYVFYTQTVPVASSLGGSLTVRTVLLRMTVNCTGASPVISSPPTPIDENFTGECGIAVSKKTNGTRWLYIRDRQKLAGYPISTTGVGSAVNFNAPLGGDVLELDLSPNGTQMAMSITGGGPSVLLADIDPSTGAVTNFRSVGPSPYAFGVEFSPDSKTLYISGTQFNGPQTIAGIFTYTVATASSLAFLTASNLQGLGQTALELAFDGKIYGCGTNGGLIGINPVTNTLAAPIAGVTVTQPSGYYINPLSGQKGYILPEQIDGEDYTFFFEGLEPRLGAVQAGGLGLNPNKFQNYYTCQSSIPLTATLTNVTQVKVILDRANADGTLVGNASPLSSPFFTAGTALNLLTVFGSNYFLNSPGYYRLTYEGYNACSNVRRVTGLIRVTNGVPVANFNFRTGQTGAAAVPGAPTTVTAPANVGGIGGAVELSNTATAFDVYRAVIEQYANGTYTTVGTVLDGVFANGASSIRLNDIMNQALGTAPGTNYFAAQLNQVYRILLTLENTCGPSSTTVGYFTPTTTAYRNVAGSSNGTSQQTKATLALYPNPGTATDGIVQLRYELPATQAVEIRLLNLTTGRQYPTALAQSVQTAGTHQLAVDLTGLPAGQYVAELVGEQQARVRFAKAE